MKKTLSALLLFLSLPLLAQTNVYPPNAPAASSVPPPDSAVVPIWESGVSSVRKTTVSAMRDGLARETIFDPRDYAALGTSNDTATFQAAIDACDAGAIGGTVIVPAGNWNVCGIKMKSYCQFKGIAERASKLTATASCAEVLKLNSTTVGWVTISDLWIEGNEGAAASSIGVLIDQDGAAYTGSGPIFLRNLMVTNTGGDGIKFRGSRSGRVLSTTVRGSNGHCYSFVPGATTTGVSDMILTDTNGEGCLGDLVHCESCVAQTWSAFKGGGVTGTDRGFFFDSSSHNNKIVAAEVDGVVTTAWYFDSANNVCMGCDSYDAADATTAAVVFTANADDNLFYGFVKTALAAPITGYAVNMPAGATGNRVNVAIENMVAGGFVAGSDITLNKYIQNGFAYVSATSRVLCRGSAAAGPEEACTLGAGLANSTTTLITDSSEADFLKSGALTCGASTQGKMQVHTTPLQYCDNAATPALQYAAYGNSTGESTAAANNSVALTTDTTGNYAAGDGEAGSATGLVCTTCVDTTDLANDAATDAKVANAQTIAGGTIGTSAITLVQSTTPAPTAEGVIEWDTDDDALAIGTGAATLVFDSGTFSTACVAVTNVAAVVNRAGWWSRIGPEVTMHGACDIDPTSAAIRTVFSIVLPVASNLALSGDLGGGGGFDTGSVVGADGCKPDTTNDLALCYFMADATAGSSTHNWIIKYTIK